MKRRSKKRRHVSAELQTQEAAIERRDLVSSVLFFAITLVIYGLTVDRGIHAGDNAELVAVAHTWGVAHPPGYPLFTFLTKLFTYIPVGSIAWRANLFSAAAGALAASLLFLTALKWTKSLPAAIIAAGLFAFTPVVWTYSTQAEVFSLNNLFVAGLLALTYFWFRSPSKRLLLAMALWTGLAFSNHHTFVFYAFTIFAAALYYQRTLVGNLRTLGLIAACVVMGMSAYVYMPLADITPSPVGWGNTSSLDGFLNHFFRREFGTFKLAAVTAEHSPIPGHIFELIKSFFTSFLFIGPLFLFYGFKNLDKKDQYARTWLVAVGFYLLILISLSNLDLKVPAHLEIQSRFWMQAYAVFALAMGLGFSSIAGIAKLPQKVVVSLALAIVSIQVILHFPSQWTSYDAVYSKYAEAILQPLPQKALVISSGDHLTNPVRYEQHVNGLRKDVIIVDVQLLKTPWYKRTLTANHEGLRFPGPYLATNIRPDGFQLKDFLLFNRDKPLFFCTSYQTIDPRLTQVFDFYPYGLCQQLVPKNDSIQNQNWRVVSSQAFLGDFGEELSRLPRRGWLSVIRSHYWIGVRAFATMLLRVAMQSRQIADFQQAAILLEKYNAQSGENDPAAYLNLGTTYQFLARKNPTDKEKMLKAWTKYLAIADPADEQRAKIQILVNQHRNN